MGGRAAELSADLAKLVLHAFSLGPPSDLPKIDRMLLCHKDGLGKALAIVPVEVMSQSVFYAVSRRDEPEGAGGHRDLLDGLDGFSADSQRTRRELNKEA